jgi:hypothetical protein
MIAVFGDERFHKLDFARRVLLRTDGLEDLALLGLGVDLSDLVPLGGNRTRKKARGCDDQNHSLHAPSRSGAGN